MATTEIISILFLPALIYRYSLKATALVYLPIIWLISTPKNANLTKKMEAESKIFTAYLMFFYALFILFILTLLPFYLNINSQSILTWLPTFVTPDIYHIFFSIEFNFWHLTRFIAATITIIFFFTFHRILKLREGDQKYGDHFGAKLLQLDIVRKVCTVFTLLVSLYLMYQAIPEGMINSVWDNMKLLPN